MYQLGLALVVCVALWSCWSIGCGAHLRRDPYDIHDYKNHSCIRPCEYGSKPRTCRYYFLVEHYSTLSAACYGCPSRKSHCSLPQCVTGNGIFRPVLTVNRMVPGPSIHVCQGDTIEVEVDNRMEGGEGTTIHWHGVLQKGTPYMDGTSMVTQCPIPKWSKMIYRFSASEAGSHFWHSHAALQRSDGIFGPMVIRQPPETDPQASLYDLDLPEHAIMLNDWSDRMSVESFVGLFHKGEMARPSGILVNGRGRAIGGLAIPFEEFRVSAGLRYRFRVIYSGILNCPIYVRVDGHKLLVISSDGGDFQPVEVDSFTIYSGERYDFVLEAKEKNAHNDSYWIRFKGEIACAPTEIIQAAILRYSGDQEPPGEVTYSNTVRTEQEKSLNDMSGVTSDNNVQIVDLKSLDPDTHQEDLIAKPDKQFYIALARSMLPDERFLAPPNPDCHPIPTAQTSAYGMTDVTTNLSTTLSSVTESSIVDGDKCQPTRQYNLQLNYITGRLPPAPPLTQYNDIHWKLLCNDDNIRRDCTTYHCECVHTLTVDKDDLVELVLISPRAELAEGRSVTKAHDGSQLIHPMHLHGHSVRVVTMMRLKSDISVASVKAMDARGEISRLRSHAPYKDTIPVGDHSVVIVRFRADNPGFWFFHCHIELHTELGMALVFQAGNVTDMPQPPDAFPKCHSWFPDYSVGRPEEVDVEKQEDGQQQENGLEDEEEGNVEEERHQKMVEQETGKQGQRNENDEKERGKEEKRKKKTKGGGIEAAAEMPWIPADSESGSPQSGANGTGRPFLDNSSLMIIAVAVLISLALPALFLALLSWRRRRGRSQHQWRWSTYERIKSSDGRGDVVLYRSTSETGQ